jgi:uncharacterized cupredoxin-like copper-binding protein
MTSRTTRLLTTAALGACIALIAAIPAFASSSKTVTTAVNVSLSKSNEFHFLLSKSTVPHGVVKFTFTNNGNLPHDFKVCSSNKGGTATACTGKSTPMITPGNKATLTVSLTKAGKYEYLCTVSGHAAAGMNGLVTVK